MTWNIAWQCADIDSSTNHTIQRWSKRNWQPPVIRSPLHSMVSTHILGNGRIIAPVGSLHSIQERHDGCKWKNAAVIGSWWWSKENLRTSNTMDGRFMFSSWCRTRRSIYHGSHATTICSALGQGVRNGLIVKIEWVDSYSQTDMQLAKPLCSITCSQLSMTPSVKPRGGCVKQYPFPDRESVV